MAILIGSNTYKCTATFSTPRGTLNTDDDVHTYLARYGIGLDNNAIQTLMDLYPDDPVRSVLESSTLRTRDFSSKEVPRYQEIAKSTPARAFWQITMLRMALGPSINIDSINSRGIIKRSM